MQGTSDKTPPSDNKKMKSTPLKEDSNTLKPVEGTTSSFGVQKSPEGINPFGEGFKGFAGKSKSFGSLKGNSNNNTGLSKFSTSKGSSMPPYQAFIQSEKNSDGSSTTYQYNTITCSPAYRNSSIEELRLQDYQQGKCPTGKAISVLSDREKTEEKMVHFEEGSERGEGKEEKEVEVKQDKAENKSVAALDTKSKSFSFGKSVESSPKDPKFAFSMPATAKEPFSFGSSTKHPATIRAQATTFPFTFGSDNSANHVSQRPKFGEAANTKPEAGTSSITNGFADFAISSTTASSKEYSTEASTSTSKDLLHAYIEDIVKLQVKEEVQKLIKEGKLGDELHKTVKKELIQLMGDAMKKL